MENNILNQKITKKMKEDDKLVFSTSLIFDDNIDQLWLYIRDISAEAANLDFFDNFKFIKGNNTWTVGNTCSMYWVGVTNMVIKCVSIKIDRTRKEIKWKYKYDIGISYYKSFILYRITQSKKTLVKVFFSRPEKINNLIDYSQTLNYYSNLQYEVLLKQSKYLKNLKKDIISYQSCIINKGHKKIWELISNFKKVAQFISYNVKNLEYNGPINEIGSFIKYFNDKLKRFVFLKIIKYKKSEQKNCWSYTLEAIGTDNNNIPKITEFKITKISDNRTQISIFHQFAHNSNLDYIQEFEINKKETIKKILKYIEENDDKFVTSSHNDESNCNINI